MTCLSPPSQVMLNQSLRFRNNSAFAIESTEKQQGLVNIPLFARDTDLSLPISRTISILLQELAMPPPFLVRPTLVRSEMTTWNLHKERFSSFRRQIYSKT